MSERTDEPPKRGEEDFWSSFYQRVSESAAEGRKQANERSKRWVQKQLDKTTTEED